MESTKFYAKKLEGLKIIRGHLVAVDRVYGDLVKLEDSQPCGDSFQEYAELNTMLSDLRSHLEDHINAVEATVEYSKPQSVTGAEVHASYLACLR